MLLLLALLSAPVAFGACKNVDHSDHFGAIRDQGGAGWCFAYSSADLLGEFLKVKPPDEISAFDVATQYLAPNREKVGAAIGSPENLKLMDGKDYSLVTLLDMLRIDDSFHRWYGEYDGKTLGQREGGMPGRTPVTLFVAGGYCLESKLPSRPVKGAPNRPIWSGPSEDAGEHFVFDQVASLEKERRVHDLLPPRCSSVNFGLMPELVDPKLRKSVSELALREVRAAVDARCGTRHNFTPPHVAQYPFNPGTLQDILLSGRSSEITYNSLPLASAIIHEKHKYEDEGYDHSSLVVGMRKSGGGSCQYKIRNSWGADCSLYDPAVAHDCKAGTFWVDEAFLGKVAYSLTDYH